MTRIADETSLWTEEWFGADWTRRDTLDALARGGLAAFLAAAGVGTKAHASTDEVVRIGYLPITDAAALLVAHARGLFEEEGLKVEAPTPVRSWSALIEAFAAGRVNVVHFLKPIPVWMRYNNKFPVKLLAWAHTNGSGLVVGPHTTVREFKDLGGARIAVPFWYSMHNVVLQFGLRQVGSGAGDQAGRRAGRAERSRTANPAAAGNAARARRQEDRRLHRGRALQRA